MTTDRIDDGADPRFSDRYDEWLRTHAVPPPSLFHYTTVEGLLAILQSRHVWATDSRFMNDPTELVYATELMQEVAQKELAGSDDESQRGLAEWIEKTLAEKRSNARIYVVCFCSDGDLLSQWRGYGAFGGGYSLGFDPGRMFGKDAHECPPWRVLRRVVYDPDEQRGILRGWIRDLTAPGVDWRHLLATKFPTLFSEWLISFKHPSYREEGEWRLIQFGREFDGDPSKGKLRWAWPARFRARRGEVIPYADFDLTQANAKLPGEQLIREVVFGPTVDARRGETAVTLCCEINKLPKPTFRRSQIPFVS